MGSAKPSQNTASTGSSPALTTAPRREPCRTRPAAPAAQAVRPRKLSRSPTNCSSLNRPDQGPPYIGNRFPNQGSEPCRSR